MEENKEITQEEKEALLIKKVISELKILKVKGWDDDNRKQYCIGMLEGFLATKYK